MLLIKFIIHNPSYPNEIAVYDGYPDHSPSFVPDEGHDYHGEFPMPEYSQEFLVAGRTWPNLLMGTITSDDCDDPWLSGYMQGEELSVDFYDHI